jgi:16S rRNA (guanine966-N2)-methyltransferase
MLRLTGGIFRGRTIQSPSTNQTRPTQAKLRQALFNSLQSHIPEARVLDLFAGSGALGFEALSRGATEIVFVESARNAIKLIEQNAETLEVEDQIHILRDSAHSITTKLAQFAPFDVILADPPYEEGWELKLLTTWPWSDLLTPDGHFCLEWGLKKSVVTALPDRVPFLEKVREKNYGDSVLTTYKRL